MTQATRVHSTPRRTVSKTKPKLSAISQVKLSGFELVPTRKTRGKKATVRDYATIDFKPWTRKPGMGPTELIPSNDVWRSHCTACRLAYAIMLRPREELIAMHGEADDGDYRYRNFCTCPFSCKIRSLPGFQVGYLCRNQATLTLIKVAAADVDI